MDEPGADQDLDEGEAEDIQNELAELLGDDDDTIETADLEADREMARQIITALAAAYPLTAFVRDSLPLTPVTGRRLARRFRRRSAERAEPGKRSSREHGA